MSDPGQNVPPPPGPPAPLQPKSRYRKSASFINPFPLKSKIPTAPSTTQKRSISPPNPNRSFYSDQIITGNTTLNPIPDAPILPSLVWQANSPGNSPKISSQPLTPDPFTKKAKLKAIGLTTENKKISDFTEDSFRPKVQVSYTVPPGTKPRRVDVERSRREFNLTNSSEFIEICESEGVVTSELIPAEYMYYNKLSKPGYGQYRPDYKFKRYLNLTIFDNTEYETKNADEWLAQGSGQPVPALAYVPTKSSDAIPFEWRYVGVVGFHYSNGNPQTTEYFVQLVDDKGRVKIDMKTVKSSTFPIESNQFRVNRTNLFFVSENPRNYAKRLKECIEKRNLVDERLRNLYLQGIKIINRFQASFFEKSFWNIRVLYF